MKQAKNFVAPRAPKDEYLSAARVYLEAARALDQCVPKHPIVCAYLSGHALECTLKAFLSVKGEQALLKSHDLTRLWKKSKCAGLQIGAIPTWCSSLNKEYSREGYRLRYLQQISGMVLPNTTEMLAEVDQLLRSTNTVVAAESVVPIATGHPINLAVRFMLEIAALVALGAWGYHTRADAFRFAVALALPLVAAVAWGVLNVPGDPSRSGSAPVAVPGWLRLIIELALFAFATWTLNDLGFRLLAAGFATVVVLHYLVSYDRIRWLLSK